MSLPVPTEAEEGKALVAYLRLRGLPFSHIPNETGHDLAARKRAIRMKQQGTSKGFPDYIVLIPHERSTTSLGHVLAIELKRQKGSSVSQEQKDWIKAFKDLASSSVDSCICKGADEAINFIEEYLHE